MSCPRAARLDRHAFGEKAEVSKNRGNECEYTQVGSPEIESEKGTINEQIKCKQ